MEVMHLNAGFGRILMLEDGRLVPERDVSQDFSNGLTCHGEAEPSPGFTTPSPGCVMAPAATVARCLITQISHKRATK